VDYDNAAATIVQSRLQPHPEARPVVEAALHAPAQVVARPALVSPLGARRVPALVRSGDVAELGANILESALDRAALCEGEALLGLGPERPLRVGDAVPLAVALNRGRALAPAL
jgi:hypothetical protein